MVLSCILASGNLKTLYAVPLVFRGAFSFFSNALILALLSFIHTKKPSRP
jgi:hypothetical protein